MARAVKCPQCGAADVRKTGEGEYTCNYCESKIILEQPQIDFSKLFKSFTFLRQNSVSPTSTNYNKYAQEVKVKTQRTLVFIIVLAFAAVLTGILVSVFANNSTVNSSTMNNGWQISYTQQTYYTYGSKGAAIWIFREENENWKNYRRRLIILNPQTKKEFYNKIIEGPLKNSSAMTSVWDTYQGGKVFGDTIYFTPKAEILEAYNIYTGKKIMARGDFEKLAGMKIASANAYSTSEDNHLRVKGADGTDFYYFPNGNRFIKESEFRDKDRDIKTMRYYFIMVGNGDKKGVMRVGQKINPHERTGYLHRTSIKEYLSDKNYYQKYYNIFSLDSVPAPMSYFDAEFLNWNDTSYILAFKEDIISNSPRFVAAYTLRGKELWKQNLEEIKVFKKESKDETVSYQFLQENGGLIIARNNGKKGAVQVNLTNGKVLWQYAIEK